MVSAKSILISCAPKIDKTLLDYAVTYFDDLTSDQTVEGKNLTLNLNLFFNFAVKMHPGILDFLTPILIEAECQKIQETCTKLASLNEKQALPDKTETRLKSTVNMKDSIASTFVGGGKGMDIRHTLSSKVPTSSIVDQKKLRAAEAK